MERFFCDEWLCLSLQHVVVLPLSPSLLSPPPRRCLLQAQLSMSSISPPGVCSPDWQPLLMPPAQRLQPGRQRSQQCDPYMSVLHTVTPLEASGNTNWPLMEVFQFITDAHVAHSCPKMGMWPERIEYACITSLSDSSSKRTNLMNLSLFLNQVRHNE